MLKCSECGADATVCGVEAGADFQSEGVVTEERMRELLAAEERAEKVFKAAAKVYEKAMQAVCAAECPHSVYFDSIEKRECLICGEEVSK